MARLFTYQQQTETPTLREQPRASVPPASQAFPEAIEKVSSGLARFAEGEFARDEAQAKAWTASALSKARLDWASNMRERQAKAQPGAPGFTPAFLTDFDAYVDEAIEGAPTDTSKRFFRSQLSALRGELAEKAIEFEAGARVSYIETAHEQGIRNAEVLMNEDPGQYKAALAEQLEMIRVAEVGPTKKTELTLKAINRVSGAAVRSQIDDSPTAFLQSIGLYPDKNGKINGDLKGITGNTAFDALTFDDRMKFYELAVKEKARIDKEAEDAIAGRTTKSSDAAVRRLFELLGSDPIEAERFALDANRRGVLNQDDMKQGITKARDTLRQQGPKSEYERSRNYVIQSLDPGPTVTDPAERTRYAEAVDMFDRWVSEDKRTDDEIFKKGREVVRRFQFISMRDTMLVLPQPKHATISRADPARAQIEIAGAMQSLKDRLAKGEISQRDYDEDVVILERWLKAATAK